MQGQRAPVVADSARPGSGATAPTLRARDVIMATCSSPSRSRGTLLSLLATASLLGAVACRRDAGPPDALVSERAKAALGPFKTTLKAELTGALADSPERAVAVCAARAPELARAASRDGVVVGRSSEKLRNPANAARPWLVPVMTELAKDPSDTASRVVRLPGGRRGYAEAIRVAPQCVLCHGKNLSPNLAAAIDARYPTDRARGFEVGDFRGVFWVELEPSALR